MTLLEFNFKPTDRQLRQFGVICLFALPLIGWFWGAGWGLLGILTAIGATLAIVGLVIPKVLTPLFVGLMLLAAPIGMVVGEIATLLIYFFVFLPLAILFRILGRDALHRKLDRPAKTYWQPKKSPGGPKSYYRQF